MIGIVEVLQPKQNESQPELRYCPRFEVARYTAGVEKLVACSSQ